MIRDDDSSALTQGADSVLGSPLRLLTGTLIFVLAVYVVSTCGFVYAGWPFGDAGLGITVPIPTLLSGVATMVTGAPGGGGVATPS